MYLWLDYKRIEHFQLIFDNKNKDPISWFSSQNSRFTFVQIILIMAWTYFLCKFMSLSKRNEHILNQFFDKEHKIEYPTSWFCTSRKSGSMICSNHFAFVQIIWNKNQFLRMLFEIFEFELLCEIRSKIPTFFRKRIFFLNGNQICLWE